MSLVNKFFLTAEHAKDVEVLFSAFFTLSAVKQKLFPFLGVLGALGGITEGLKAANALRRDTRFSVWRKTL